MLSRPAAQAAGRSLRALVRTGRLPLCRLLTGPVDFRNRMAFRLGHTPRVCESAAEAVDPYLNNDSMVFIQAGCATPQPLVEGMVSVAKSRNLRGVRTTHMHLEGTGPLPLDDPEAAEHITPVAPFVGANLRQQIQNGEAMYIPVHLGELPLLFRRRVIVPDLALVHVSPPDRHGYCTLGTSVDWTRSAIEHSVAMVGLVNPRMPRIYGDGVIHYSQFDAVVHTDAPIFQHHTKALLPEEVEIGKHVAALVPDGATLQMGIGSVPDAALAQLGRHKHLGVHTEMFSDGILPLVESGVLDNSYKTAHRGKIVSAFCAGSQNLYDFLDDNPAVRLLDVSYTNDVNVIQQQHQMVGINSCIEMDLTGQAASGSIGTRIYSGFGGQVDFLRGAAMCPDGKAILAFTSRTTKGKNRIVPELQAAAGVVTTRAVVQYVVTEYGSTNLFGLTLPERARELIKLAHPEDREALEAKAFERFGKAFRRL